MRSYFISLAALIYLPVAYAVEFNTDVLDAADRNNIDFSRFSQARFILHGQY